MKSILGILLIVAGILVGLYFGLYWAFIGGIIAVIEQIRAPHLDATITAFAIARILFADAIGSACAFVLILPGALMAGFSRR